MPNDLLLFSHLATRLRRQFESDMLLRVGAEAVSSFLPPCVVPVVLMFENDILMRIIFAETVEFANRAQDEHANRKTLEEVIGYWSMGCFRVCKVPAALLRDEAAVNRKIHAVQEGALFGTHTAIPLLGRLIVCPLWPCGL